MQEGKSVTQCVSVKLLLPQPDLAVRPIFFDSLTIFSIDPLTIFIGSLTGLSDV